MKKSITGQDLKKIRIGQAVVSCTGPGHFPEFGMGQRNGVVIGIGESKFYSVFLKVKWDDGTADSVLSLQNPKFKCGCGVYAVPSLEEAIR